MITTFNMTIKPSQMDLRKKLNIKTIQIKNDDTVEWPITTQVYDGEVLAHCDHAGMRYEGIDTEYLVYDPVYGNYMPQERTEMLYICDKCNETSVDGEEWA